MIAQNNKIAAEDGVAGRSSWSIPKREPFSALLIN